MLFLVLTSLELQRIYTDSDVRNPEILSLLDVFAKQIEEMVVEQGLVLPENHELVLFLEKRKVSGGYNRCYYFVDHKTRTLFWVQECDPIDDLQIVEVTALKAPYDISACLSDSSVRIFMVHRA